MSEINTQLCQAIYKRDGVLMKKLISMGAESNAQTEGNGFNPPVHEAAAIGFIEGLEILCAAGGDVNCESKHRATPLMAAENSCKIEAGRWLLRHGASPFARNMFGETSLHMALSRGSIAFADMIIHERPELLEVELPSLAKRIIEFSSNIDVAVWLLQAGVSPNLIGASDKRESWLMCAQSAQSESIGPITDMLLGAGANVDFQDRDGSTALHNAVFFRSVPSMLRLLRGGANPDLPNHKGEAVRQLLMEDGAKELCEAFLAWEASVAASEAIQNSPVPLGLKTL